MASTSARPKGVRPPCREFSPAATRCSCSDQPPVISAAASLRCPHGLPALSGWPRRPPETDLASRTALPRSPPVRARVFRGLPRAAAAVPQQTYASPTSGPGRHAALRDPLQSPSGLLPGIPKLVLSPCSYTPPRDL